MKVAEQINYREITEAESINMIAAILGQCKNSACKQQYDAERRKDTGILQAGGKYDPADYGSEGLSNIH